MPASPHQVFCVKLNKQAEGLAEVPFDGPPLGPRIYENVSKEAWAQPEAQEFLIQQMEQYFFGQGAAPPPDYVPPAH
jgi:Fe-S cluster biosynthesis and repair protein YggX